MDAGTADGALAAAGGAVAAAGSAVAVGFASPVGVPVVATVVGPLAGGPAGQVSSRLSGITSGRRFSIREDVAAFSGVAGLSVEVGFDSAPRAPAWSGALTSF